MDKNTTKSTFAEYLSPLNFKFFMELIAKFGLDKYTKKLDSVKLIKLLIFAQLHQTASLANISLDLRTNKKLQQYIQLDSISDSQLSRKLRSSQPEVYEVMFNRLVEQILRERGVKKGTQALGRINLIDSSTLSLCLTKYRWAEFRSTKSGIKMHTRVVYQDDQVCPDKLVLKSAKDADRVHMNELVVQEPNALNVFDRGYVDYRVYDLYCENGTRFVTRLKDKAVITVIEEKVVDSQSAIKREAIVILGTPGVNQMKHKLRLIETQDSEGNPITIITNEMTMSATELADVYRCRWQIELFFKWIKQHLHIKRFYGTSASAVYTQIHIALITYCLLLLLKSKVAFQGKLLVVYKLLQRCWSDPFDVMFSMLYGHRTRTSKGRRSYDHERIFRETLQQYEQGVANHLDDLEYDPIN